VLILVTLAALGLVYVLVTWRRRTAGRWQPHAAREVVRPGVPWCARVWLLKDPPQRSRRRAGDRVLGELCVDADAGVAEFRASDGTEAQLTKVDSIKVGAAGTDFVNTWVEVRCALNGRAVVLYLNDARWLGWKPVLTNANSRLADALASLMAR
jgi:hypothetical protein